MEAGWFLLIEERGEMMALIGVCVCIKFARKFGWMNVLPGLNEDEDEEVLLRSISS